MHGLLESDAGTPPEVAKFIQGLTDHGHSLEVLDAGPEAVRVKVIEIETSAAHEVTVPRELLESPIFAHVRRTHERLREVTGGLPPFTLKLGKKDALARTFDALRDRALELAKEGIQISRFKGLGEDESRAAVGHDDGPAAAHAHPCRRRGRLGCRSLVLASDGEIRWSRAVSSSNRTHRTSGSSMSNCKQAPLV